MEAYWKTVSPQCVSTLDLWDLSMLEEKVLHPFHRLKLLNGLCFSTYYQDGLEKANVEGAMCLSPKVSRIQSNPLPQGGKSPPFTSSVTAVVSCGCRVSVVSPLHVQLL